MFPKQIVVHKSEIENVDAAKTTGSDQVSKELSTNANSMESK